MKSPTQTDQFSRASAIMGVILAIEHRRALVVVLGYFAIACGRDTQNHSPSAERDFVSAVKSVVRLQACARSNDTGCVDSLVAAGSTQGSVLRYLPGNTDSVTGGRSYWVMSRDANDGRGRPVFLGDASGQVFEARYEPRWDHTGPDSAATLLLLRTPVAYLRDVFDCIRSTYGSYLGEYPVDLSHTEHREPPGRCISFPDQSSAIFQTDQGNRVGAGKFVVQYQASPPDSRRGYPTSFSLQAWPVPYGEASIRSFFVDTSGSVHFTSENRRATSADPLVFGCEGYGVPYDCTVRIAESIGLTGRSVR
jgi:hypothetical protein